MIRRRVFPLDSRAVWIESQNVKSFILPRENLCLGPGEYNPGLINNHVSSYAYKPRVFQELSGESYDLDDVSLASKRARSRRHSKNQNICDKSDVDDDSSFSQYHAHQPLLEAMASDGKRKVATPVFIGSYPNDRIAVTQALPDYDVNYNSSQIRPRTTLGLINRVYERGVKKLYSSLDKKKPSIKMPILKSRQQQKIQFDVSSYDHAKQMSRNEESSRITDINPKLLNDKIKFKIFNAYSSNNLFNRSNKTNAK